jgi:hypothetical protein
MTPSEADDPEIRKIRHDMRGNLNLIRLCTATLQLGGDAEELLEWVAHIETAADDVIKLLDQADALTASQAS